jgi:hypothetical protein
VRSRALCRALSAPSRVVARSRTDGATLSSSPQRWDDSLLPILAGRAALARAQGRRYMPVPRLGHAQLSSRVRRRAHLLASLCCGSHPLSVRTKSFATPSAPTSSRRSALRRACGFQSAEPVQGSRAFFHGHALDDRLDLDGLGGPDLVPLAHLLALLPARGLPCARATAPARQRPRSSARAAAPAQQRPRSSARAAAPAQQRPRGRARAATSPPRSRAFARQRPRRSGPRRRRPLRPAGCIQLAAAPAPPLALSFSNKEPFRWWWGQE